MDFGLFELPVNFDFLILTFDLMKLTSSRNNATPLNQSCQVVNHYPIFLDRVSQQWDRGVSNLLFLVLVRLLTIPVRGYI